jgi:hypothetical protein
VKLPVQPDKYDRSMEQQRSGIIEREVARSPKRDADETISGSWGFEKPIEFFPGQDGGWRDMLGQIVPRANVPTSPTWTQMGTTPFWSYLFALNDEIWIPYHIQHDYAPGTPIYLHVHWTTDGTQTNTVKWQFEYCYAKGFNQGNFDVSGGRSTTVEQAAQGTAWRHMVSEISTPISDANFEVDGVLMVHITRITNGGTNNTDKVFMILADCHYQCNAFNTKNRTPDFYA